MTTDNKDYEATIEEKVEKLASNPIRYYTGPNIWIGRDNSRIEELNSLLKESEYKENFKLCSRIVQVKKILSKIYSKNIRVEVVYSDMINVNFTTLVIRIERVNEVYGDLIDFISEYNLYGVFNEKIYCLSEMCSPPNYLEELVETVLEPLGLIQDKDYCFLSEQLTVGHGFSSHEIIHKEHPDIKNIDWLGSVILENGNWICYLDSSQDSKNKIIPNLFYQYMRRFNFDKMKLNPTIVKITDTTLYFKLDNQNELLSFDFNTLFVLSEIRYDFKA